MAASGLNSELIHELVKLGANVEGLDIDATPLHRAVMGLNPLKNVEALLLCGANANSRTITNKLTPLHLAALGPVDVAELLLQHGAEVNARTPDNITPLHQAEENKVSPTMMAYLVSMGATL